MQRARAFGATREHLFPGARHDAPKWELEMRLVSSIFDAEHPFRKAKCRLEPAGRAYEVAVADTDETRARGMIGRSFAEGFEGMLFAYDEDVQHAFHMNGVTEQLYIVFFDADGRVMDHLGMFREDPYHYRPQRPFRYALELPAVEGSASSPWDWLSGQTLHIDES